MCAVCPGLWCEVCLIVGLSLNSEIHGPGEAEVESWDLQVG